MKTTNAIIRFLTVLLTLSLAGALPAQTEETDTSAQTEDGGPSENAMEDEGSENTFENRCQLEVEELHQFFQDWTTGAIESTDENFERFSGVTAEGFVIISPSGRATDLQALLDGMRGSYGRSPEGARIWIENFQLRRIEGGVAIVTYEEWQEIASQKRGRLSTAVFREREGTPNGVEWLHVHETGLPRQ